MKSVEPESDPSREFFVYDKLTDRIEPLRDYAAHLLEMGGKEPPADWDGVQVELHALDRLDAACRRGEMLDADDLKKVASFKLFEISTFEITENVFQIKDWPYEEYEEDYLIRANIEFDKAFSDQYPDAQKYEAIQEYIDETRSQYPPEDDHER